MTDRSDPATALIEHIPERFHATHRRELPGIVALARTVESQAGARGLGDAFDAMARTLEAHMFKEEMRHFPMMEQGGNRLIGHLIDDLLAAHRVHEDTLKRLSALLQGLQVPPDHLPRIDALRASAGKLFDDLAQHVAAQDERLFAIFDAAAPGDRD